MIKFTVEDPETPDYVCAGDIKNQSIAPLGLFRSCSQVYHESRAIFYRHHDFKFHIWQGDKGRDKGLLCHLKTMLGMKRHDTCPEKKVFKWLDAIGLDMQKQIRSIEFVIPFYGSARLRPHPSFIDDLHEKLSEYAFVHCSSTEGIHSYHGEVDLWRLGKLLFDRDPKRVLQIKYTGWADALPKRFFPGTPKLNSTERVVRSFTMRVKCGSVTSA